MEKLNGKRESGYLALVVTLAAMTMFTAMCTDLYLPGFPLVAQSLHVQMVDLQLTFTSFTFGIGFGQLIYGPLSDRFGRKNPAAFGLVLFIAASVLCGTAHTLKLLIIYRFLQALGGAAGAIIGAAASGGRGSGALAGAAIGAAGGAMVGAATTPRRCARFGYDYNGNRVCVRYYAN